MVTSGNLTTATCLVSVITTTPPDPLAGQLVTVAGHLVSVLTWVAYTVKVVEGPVELAK